MWRSFRQGCVIPILFLSSGVVLLMTIHKTLPGGDRSLGIIATKNTWTKPNVSSPRKQNHNTSRKQQIRDFSLSSNVSNGTSWLDVQPIKYHNLSCPFEWSKYSCFRHGQEERAKAALDFANSRIKVASKERYNPAAAERQQSSARLILVGDSTMRQILIAMGCRFWNEEGSLADYALPWLDNWPCHDTLNCIASGAHSGFNVASLRLTSGAEIHFLPHSGTVTDARGQNPAETGILQRWKRELMLQQIHHSSNNFSYPQGTLTLGPNTAMLSKYSEFLSSNDTIVYNLGLHMEQRRTVALQEFADFGKQLLSSPSRERPQLVYLSTVTQHFRTESGEHDPSQHQRLKALECQPTVKANRRRDEERHSLHETVHVDRFLNYDTIETGDFHIGGGDCTHYCMPGPPDVTAEKLVQTWLKNQSFIDNNL